MKMITSMKASKKVSLRRANEIHISPSYAIKTKNDNLNIAMNDWEQKVIAINNQDAES